MIFLFIAVIAGLVGVLLYRFKPAAQPPTTRRAHEKDPHPEKKVDGSSQSPTLESEANPNKAPRPTVVDFT
jgi:hypothetical protein